MPPAFAGWSGGTDMIDADEEGGLEKAEAWQSTFDYLYLLCVPPGHGPEVVEGSWLALRGGAGDGFRGRRVALSYVKFREFMKKL